MKFKIKFRKFKYTPKRHSSRKVMINSIGKRLLFLFFIFLLDSELKLEYEIIDIIIQLVLLPSIVTILLVGIFGIMAERAGGNFLKKYTIQIKLDRKKLEINFFTIFMYLIVLSIYIYLYIN